MGFDMNVVNEDGTTVNRETCPNNYWRRNISGGVAQAEKLVALGMASWPTSEPGRFPDRPAHTDVAYEQAEADENYDYEHPDYAAILFPYLRDRRDATVGINAAKLCGSNDGWWVTREECQEALTAWEAAGKPAVDDFGSGPIGDTIPFLTAAAEHHGFRIY